MAAAAVAVRRGHHHRQGRFAASSRCSKIKGELYYAFAETRPVGAGARHPGDLKAALQKTDVKATVEVFPGTHHGFCFPERAVYDTQAAETTWSKIFAMWDRHLK